MKPDIHTFDDFWPYYLRQHSRTGTRLFHAIGSVLALTFVVMAVFINGWFLLFAPLVGYGFAWFSHLFVEGNRPATFGHPFYSLAADYRMLALMLTGRLRREVEKHAALPSEL